MFKLLGILLLILYFGYLAQEYTLMKKQNNNQEEIVYRYRPTMATTNLGNESFEHIDTNFSAILKAISSPSITHGPETTKNLSFLMLFVIIVQY